MAVTVGTVLLALWAFGGDEVAGAESAPAAGESAAADGVLLLHNGGVLEGRIWRDAGRYVVARSNSQLSVPAKDVAKMCRSLEEAYHVQRQQHTHPTAEAHLELAAWCLRHDLKLQASGELAEARRLDPRNPKLALLERRLAVAKRPSVESRPTRVETTQPDATPDEELQRLEAMARKLPDAVVERFTRKVQPLLVNNCTTAGCHQRPPVGARRDDRHFQLDRAILHGMGNRRSTLHNLEATLALVDRSTPQHSPLLTIPRQRHGEAKQPLLGSHEAENFDQLVEWVALVTNAVAVTDESLAKDGEQHAPPDAKDAAVVPAGYDADAAPAESKPRVQFGASSDPPRPIDPFDPELFNRKSK